jgi:hypothetical protein
MYLSCDLLLNKKKQSQYRIRSLPSLLYLKVSDVGEAGKVIRWRKPHSRFGNFIFSTYAPDK